MKVKCSYCQKIISIPDEYTGKDFKCPLCHQVSVGAPVAGTSDSQESSRNLWIFWIVVAAGLTMVIGFIGGVLLTKPNREKTKLEAKVEETRTTTQKETEAAEAETKRLQNELKRITDELKQAKKKEEKKVDIFATPEEDTEPRQPAEIKQIQKSVFGIYLGETLADLTKRCSVEHLADEGDFKIYLVKTDSPNVKTLYAMSFANKICSIRAILVDSSDGNYNAVIKEIKSKYKIIEEEEPISIDKAHSFLVDILGELVMVSVELEKGFMEKDKLTVTYIYKRLAALAIKVEEFKKAKKIGGEL